MKGLAFVLLLWSAPASADSNAGSTAAPILQLPIGSRAQGMGTAFTAVASDVSALYYNPAGLSRLNAQEASFSFLSGAADNKVQHLAYGAPIPFGGFSGSGYSAIGASLLFSQSGTIEVNKTASDGSLLSSQSFSAGSDFVATIGYAERVGTSPIDFGDGRAYGINHFLGLSAKYIRSTLVETYTASAFTADAGYLVNSPEAGLTLGLSALNLTGKLRYQDESDPLPTTVRGGVAYQGGTPAQSAYTLSTDAEYLTKEKVQHINAGFEYFLQRTYGLRMGYQFLRDDVAFTMGFGLRYQARFLFDYAWSMGRALSDQHRITMTVRFGGVSPSSRARRAQPFIERTPDHEPVERLDERTPATFDRPTRPRANPRREQRPSGVPGWIY